MNANPCGDLPLASLEIEAADVDRLARAGFETIGEIVRFLETNLGCGHVLPLSENGVSLFGIDFHAILAQLKARGCWTDASQFEDVSLDYLEVSDACRQSLYGTGVSTLHELVWTLEQLLIGAPTFSGEWIRYWKEIFRGLRAAGVWPDCRE